MTEKRFRVEKQAFDGYCIVDNHFDGYYAYEKQDLEKLCETLNDLSDENEKLHHTIVETEKMVQSIYDELTKLRCFKKNILRIKHSWDYLMEAIQYD